MSAVLAIHIWIHVASGDSGCSAADTHMDTRGQCVTVAAVLAIHIWIHVASEVTVAVVLAIHIWTHVASG